MQIKNLQISLTGLGVTSICILPRLSAYGRNRVGGYKYVPITVWQFEKLKYMKKKICANLTNQPAFIPTASCSTRFQTRFISYHTPLHGSDILFVVLTNVFQKKKTRENKNSNLLKKDFNIAKYLFFSSSIYSFSIYTKKLLHSKTHVRKRRLLKQFFQGFQYFMQI